MKNLKKILALAVAFVMCFTMFAGAAVFSDVTPGGDYSQAITFLSDLGVIAGKPDGSFGINDAITRADAACLIARLMTGQPNPPKNDGTVQFSDVPSGSYYETSVGYCVALGITVGTGNGQYSPLRTITDGEFIAMLTRALGYDTAEHPLAFPMGNITTAQARGLLYGVDVDYASDALRGEDAQMLYNAMFAEYDKAAANKNTFQAADDHWNVTIAEEVFGLGRLSHDLRDADNSVIGGTSTKDNGVSFHGANRNNNPTVDCDAHTWVIAGVDARYEDNTYIAFAIDDTDVKAISPEDQNWSYQEFTYNGDIKDLLGYRVELWGEYDHSGAPWDVAAIKVVDGNMTGSRAAASAFQSRYDANQAMYAYTPDMYTSDKKVEVDGKTLYIDDDNNTVNAAKINLDINTAANWMWATETDRVIATTTNEISSYTRYMGNRWSNVWNNTFASGGPYTNKRDAYRMAYVSADTKRSPLNNTWVNINFADGDQYKLFDWDGDDYIDFVVVDTAKYAEVTDKTSTRMVLEADERNIRAKNDAAGDTIDIRSRGSYSLKLDDDNLKVEGADAIEEGDVVEITVVSRVHTRGDGEIVTIKLTAVEPEVKKLEKVNVTRQEYTFDGEVIDLAGIDFFDRVELAADGQSRDDLDTIENIGKEFNLWFDRNGFLIKARVNDDTASGYLMILETLDGQDNLHTSSTAARRNLAVADVLFEDNTVGKEVEFVRNLTIDGNSRDNGYDSSNRSWNEKEVVGNVYKYYMNDDKQITRLTSMTENQFADYNFDDSKDRLGVSSGTYSRNYGFANDAVVFAAKPVKTDIATGREDNALTDSKFVRGYVRQQPHDAGQGSGTHIGGALSGRQTVHYWVDPADVMAVSVDDVPEIDNRVNGTTWRIPSAEVTHPARFISQDSESTNNKNFATTDNATAVSLPDFSVDADKWIGRVVDSGWNVHNVAAPSVWEGVFENDATDTNAATPSAHKTIPSVAFGLNRDQEIEAAVLGVDSLQFFGAGSIKLALISNVYATGNKTYEFKAAIDGKYDTFKTISADEYDIFKGTIGDSDTALSYNSMRGYLNLSKSNGTDASWNGRYRALYAEVVMNSDGLIREVRAMREVNPTVAGTTTYWDGDPVKRQFFEGNVYRVIRGVTTQLLGKNLVTWQVGPMAAGNSTLYDLSEYDDNNGYDHLEAAYDEDTKFYYIDQRVPLARNQRALVIDGFREDIDGDISAKDSGVLNASLFTDGGANSVYYFCDYAVYKNDMDRLAAVFAFDDDVSNSGETIDQKIGLKAADFDLKAVQTARTLGMSEATADEWTINVDEFNGAATAEAYFTVNGVSKQVTGATDETTMATAIAAMLNTELGAGSATSKGSLVTVTAKNANTDQDSDGVTEVHGELTLALENGSIGKYTLTKTKDGKDGEKTTPTYASTTVRIANGHYVVDSTCDAITFSSATWTLLDGKVANIAVGSYDADELAAAIVADLMRTGGAFDGTTLSARRDGNDIVITDTAISVGNKGTIDSVSFS